MVLSDRSIVLILKHSSIHHSFALCNPGQFRQALLEQKEILMLTRRNSLGILSSALAMPFVSRTGWAQAYPNRPVRLVVPFVPGGGVDLIGRLVANQLSIIWGQQVVTENKGGAGGNIGAQSVITAPPDGYTLFLGSFFLGTNPYIYPSLGYDPIADLAPVSMICSFPNLMVVSNSSQAKSVREFIANAKVNPGRVTLRDILPLRSISPD
jgi:tripartite-type tricarboxylate transporter receptor subunit TctC